MSEQREVREALEEEARRIQAAARWLGEREERHERRVRRAVAALAVVFLVGAGIAGCLTRPRNHESAELPESPPEIWATDGEQSSAPVARPMPAKPFEGQKRPPCTKVAQVELNGGCWVALEVRPNQVPGCGPDYFEHGGKCYLPVRQAPKVPTSIGP